MEPGGPGGFNELAFQVSRYHLSHCIDCKHVPFDAKCCTQGRPYVHWNRKVQEGQQRTVRSTVLLEERPLNPLQEDDFLSRSCTCSCSSPFGCATDPLAPGTQAERIV